MFITLPTDNPPLQNLFGSSQNLLGWIVRCTPPTKSLTPRTIKDKKEVSERHCWVFAFNTSLIQLNTMSIVPTDKRREMEIMALKMNDIKVENVKDSNTDFYVEFKGPSDSLYQDGVWTVYVKFPADFPYSPPAMNFVNKIYHPNIDEKNGKICLNVLNRDWSSLFDLVSLFTICLPQLLSEPNAEDPLNGEAGALMLRDKKAYEEKVKEYCLKYAQPGNFDWEQDEEGSKQEGESSEGTSDSVSASGDEGTTGPADP